MDGKTQKKSLPAHLVPGNPGNSGGKPGRSGRKPNEFIAWCQSLTEDETARRTYEARNKAGDLKVMEFAAHYAHGKPGENIKIEGDITVRVEYDE